MKKGDKLNKITKYAKHIIENVKAEIQYRLWYMSPEGICSRSSFAQQDEMTLWEIKNRGYVQNIAMEILRDINKNNYTIDEAIDSYERKTDAIRN